MRTFGAAGSTERVAALSAVAVNLAGKVQSFAVVGAGALAGGFSGIGVILTLVGGALLASTMCDFGYSSEAGRVAAKDTSRENVRAIFRRLLWHVLAALAVGPVVCGLLVQQYSITAEQYAAIAIYSGSLVATSTGVTVLYGLGKYARSTLYVGGCRMASSVALIALAAATESLYLMLPTLAMAEIVSVYIAWKFALRPSTPADVASNPSLLPTGTVRINGTFGWLGIAAILNVLTNQSDVLLVSSTLSAAEVGIFGLASQLQNAVATFAISTATTLPSFVSRHSSDPALVVSDISRARRGTGALLLVSTTLLLLCSAVMYVLNLSPSSVRNLNDILPVVVCVLSAVPSSFAFVNISICIGYGFHTRTGIARSVVGLISVGLIFGLSQVFGLWGACIASVLRDLLLLVLTQLVARQAQNYALSARTES